MIGWARWSTGNSARYWSLTIRTNGICTPRICQENERHKLLWDFEIQMDLLISARRSNLINNNNNNKKKKKKKKKKQRTCLIVEFSVPADHRIKLKECEKRDKHLELARELNKEGDIKVMVILIIIGAQGNVTKGLVQGQEDLKITGWVETVQTTVLLRSARILKRVLETYFHSDSSEKPSGNLGHKTIIIIINKKRELAKLSTLLSRLTTE